MATRKAPANFTSLLDDVQVPGREAATPQKGPLVTFHIDEDLKLPLDRLVFWGGKKASQRSVLNKALRALVLADPRSQQPMPDEDEA